MSPTDAERFEHAERFIMNEGDLVSEDQYELSSVFEIKMDQGWLRLPQDESYAKLRELWDWAIAIKKPLGSYLTLTFREERIISEEEYAAYVIEQFLNGNIAS